MTSTKIQNVFVVVSCFIFPILLILQVRLYSQIIESDLLETPVFNTPRNFRLDHWYTGPNYFKLTWEIPDTVNCYTTLSGYNIYRNFQLIDTLPSDSLAYLEVGPPLMEDDQTYYYITAIYINPDGESASTDTLSHWHAIGIQDDINQVPVIYSINQNYPNPFNSTTIIEYALPKQSFVQITIYDIGGNKVESLVNCTQEAGYYSVLWNVPQGGIGSGVYVYRIQADGFSAVRKCLLIK